MGAGGIVSGSATRFAVFDVLLAAGECGPRCVFSDMSHSKNFGSQKTFTAMRRASSKINPSATSSSAARLAMSKVVKSKHEVCREREDY
jgi:hypothetical protein